MKLRNLRKLLTDRRGISMAEVVVALTVVVMVTAAAISVVIASIRYEAKYVNETTALSYCESAVECVRFADSDETLGKMLEKLDDEFQETESGIYMLEKEGFTVTVEADFDNDEFEISAVKTNGVTIFEAEL